MMSTGDGQRRGIWGPFGASFGSTVNSECPAAIPPALPVIQKRLARDVWGRSGQDKNLCHSV